ncbi:MAG: outer membrane protein assembly factor BamA [Sphingomonadaceae bacterium]
MGEGGERVRAISAPVAGSGFGLFLLASTILGTQPVFAQAQQRPALPSAPVTSMVPQISGTIQTITVEGAQRLEPDTVRSYIDLKPGQPYDRESLDQALKALFATELFADVQIRDNAGALVIQVKENPVINRIVLEGNKRLKEDKIRPEIRLAPRQIFSRSKVRADVARIVELYRRQGRFAATVEPKMVPLSQNRVDVVFEIVEGPKSKVRKINILGNEEFSDGRLRGEMATKQTGLLKIFSSGTSYDPDRLAYDQQKLRQFYLTNGYADFRVISAVAELTPDKRDFIITYVVEEGERYKFGDVDVDSDIRDVKPETLKPLVKMRKGEWYNAKEVEDTVDTLSETAGLLGYAFADVRPEFNRDKDALTMSVTFKIADAPRVYVERIDINGNTHTKDKVIRREFRLAEGDAFNSFRVKRSRDRIQSLGFFQEKLEIEQKRGSSPDKVILEANVEEKSTGELQVSAGYSSLENFIVSLSIRERNFMGKGQELRASVDYSRYSKSIELGFTEPYVFDKNIAVGFDVFRRDYNSFRFVSGNDRDTTYEQTTTGFQLRAGVPLTEFMSLALRYGLSFDDVTLDQRTYYFNGQCDPLLAGRYLCDAIGKRTTSSVGYSLVYDNLNNRIRPSAGHRIVFGQDLAGVGGSTRYIRTTVNAKKYWGLGSGFIFSVGGEAGYIRGLGQDVRLTDRFFLGEPQIRGFDIRGVGPRVIRTFYDVNSNPPGPQAGRNNNTDDALGGDKYYLGRLELELPLGSGGRELGLRPSIFVDAGAVWGGRKPVTTGLDRFGGLANLNFEVRCQDAAGNVTATLNKTGACPTGQTLVSQIPPFSEEYTGNSAKPRLSVGFGINWNSPFGPFRIDIAKALLKEPGDDTKLFSFNVGTQF